MMFCHASVTALRAVVTLFGFVALCLGLKDSSGNSAVDAVNGNNATKGIQRFLNQKYSPGVRDRAQYSSPKETDVRSSKRKSQPTEEPTVQCGNHIMRVVVKLQDVDNLQVVAGEWQR